jgi:hypothetical protein
MVKVGDRVTLEITPGDSVSGVVAVIDAPADLAVVEIQDPRGATAIVTTPLSALRKAGGRVEGVTITGKCGGCGR